MSPYSQPANQPAALAPLSVAALARSSSRPNEYLLVLRSTALDPSLYLALRARPWLCAISVGLSGYSPGKVSMYPPLSYREGQLMYTYAETPRVVRHLFSPYLAADTCPLPENNYGGHLPPGLC